MIQITKLFTRPIAFHRIMADWTGSVNSALFLSQLCYWTDTMERSRAASGQEWDGWIFKTREQWFDETGLTRTEQETARKVLIKKKFIEEKRSGIPAKLYYKIIPKTFYHYLGKNEESDDAPTSRRESYQLESGKPTNRLVGNRPTNKEITKEITKKSTTPSPLLSAEKNGFSGPTNYAPAVKMFAGFSRNRDFHIRCSAPLSYVKGGKEGGWARSTLLLWNVRYLEFTRTKVPESTFLQVLKWYITNFDKYEFMPEARTLISFIDKFPKIQKAMARQKSERRRRDGYDLDEAEDDKSIIDRKPESKPKGWKAIRRDMGVYNDEE